MAVGESQVGSGSEPETKELQAGWRNTLRKVMQDTTARWGLYVITFVLAITAYTLVDGNLSRLTFGNVSDFAMAETLPIFEHPERLPPPGEAETNVPPAFHPDGTLEHPLGTDPNGRDYFTRIVYGAQVSVSVGLAATFLGLVGGTIIGSVAGYYGGWVDDVLMRAIETVYAIPPLILIIVFTVFVSGGSPDVQFAIVGVGIAFIPVFARIIRSEVLSVREMDYIEAARAAGVKDRNIILYHVIPNSFAPVLVYATLQIGVTILIVAGLSFLGFGAQPPTPDWGEMLQTSHGYMHSNVWLSIWPGVAIMITIMGFNLFGDGLQDALDPRIND
ncbi:ABC transporter permease [Natronobacterium gregoryi]|uniref:ABC transporter integral membrane protein n=2 Tax=Natronobacterium gregoryi TaxID=44930 RepID=L0AGW2_NATGS|nr:ABC transporter permease [Natronobacterium gregoryi]AFZ72649.1 ABC-type dipeptide/oligopeptide/nickel transport system, permease component [Natronobacterium gregoryi SP2]ELY69063.1 ABC transporter integral membrane protein [Natronobacterium gregoryi SP2]PLK20601.1 ABC transporter permease [Natronobacterium gregoryi SP2]SFI90676.1 peptide/nickel transport system permease protein [Natronobacterium gregoryi]